MTKDADTGGSGVSPPAEQYDPRVGHTENGRGAAGYRRARRDLAAALDELTTRGKTLISARYQRASRGTLIRDARRLRADSIDIVTLAVISERNAGASWTEVADALSLDETFVREHYEPIERQWSTGNGIGPIVQHREGQPLRLVGG